MNKNSNIKCKIHIFTFSFFLAVMQALENFVIPKLNKLVNAKILEIFISIFINVLAYTLIYWISKKVYSFYLLRIKYKNCNIKGTWYHIHIPYERKSNRLRGGEAIINQDLFDISVKASNRDIKLIDNKLSFGIEKETHWHYEFSEFNAEEGKLLGCYSARSPYKHEDIYHSCPFCSEQFSNPRVIKDCDHERRGIHELNVNKNATVLKGTYSDLYPSSSCGTIYFFRNQADRDDCARRFFMENSNTIQNSVEC